MPDPDQNETNQPERQSTFAALGDPNFARYCAAYIPSMSGTWIRITAMGYLVYDMTGDSTKLGLISLATSLPQVVVGFVSAVFIDRVNRRNVLVTSQLLTVLTMFFTAWLIGTDQISFARLIWISILLGSLLTFDIPVRISLIPSLVDRSLLQNAIAINSSLFNVARVIGPTLAGWLIAAVGMTWAFGITALLMLPFPIVLLTIARIRHLTPDHAGPQTSAVQQLREGWAYIRGSRELTALMLVGLVPNVFGANYVTMAPAFVRDVLHRDAGMLGLLLAANGVGTFSVAHFNTMRRRGMVSSVGLIVFGVMTVVFGLSPNVLVAFGSILLLGLSWGLVIALNDTLIQTIVEERFRGRVMSVYVMIIGLGPASAVAVGWVATQIGIDRTLALVGLIILLFLPYIFTRTVLRSID